MADTLYDRVGGEAFFMALVGRFYAAVEHEPLLRPLYPDDLTPSKRHLALFLGQYWGGPPVYNQERGHPRLRMRHLPFPIAQAQRDAWMRHMRAAVESSGAGLGDKQVLLAYLDMAATSLINQAPDQPGTRGASHR
jgi:hemoglobin